MGYLVESSGRVTLPESAEHGAAAHARQRMLAVEGSGWLRDDEVATLGELAEFAAGTELTRDGDDLVVTTSEGSDPKWSDQARAFWEALAEQGAVGRVDVEGEDESRWSYVLAGGRLEQSGRNGWDGTGEGYGWEGGGAFADPDDDEDGTWPGTTLPPGGGSATSARTLREAIRFTPEEQAKRATRYLALGGLATVGGLGLLAADRPTGWVALGIGVLDLVIGLRARRSATGA